MWNKEFERIAQQYPKADNGKYSVMFCGPKVTVQLQPHCARVLMHASRRTLTGAVAVP
jgi:hypothetical protein